MNNFLTDIERAELKRHRGEKDRRIADRIKAVLLLDSGWSYRHSMTEFFDLLREKYPMAKNTCNFRQRILQ
jgi:hypothetical protein